MYSQLIKESQELQQKQIDETRRQIEVLKQDGMVNMVAQFERALKGMLKKYKGCK